MPSSPFEATPALPITLRKVAEAAGVSVSVASRALNGPAKSYRISQGTEGRVKHTARQLGFRPSQPARALRLQKTGLIGVVVPDLANPFFASISRAVTLAAESEDYCVIMGDSRKDTRHEIRLLKQLQDRQVEALVVCPVGQQYRRLLEIQQHGTPIVLADRTFPHVELTQVTSQHQRGAEKAMRLLTSHGHRVIGVLQGLPGPLPNTRRLQGHRAGLKRAGIAIDRTLIAGQNFTESSGYQATRALLTQRPDITALFALSTPNAMGGLRAAQEMGARVPKVYRSSPSMIPPTPI